MFISPRPMPYWISAKLDEQNSTCYRSPRETRFHWTTEHVFLHGTKTEPDSASVRLVSGDQSRRGQDESTRPLVSIITMVKDGELFIDGAIKSIVAQTYPDIQYVVIDGNSSDRTLEIIRRYQSSIDYLLSEPDRSPQEARNKGLNAAKGDYIFFLLADDWINPDFIETAVNAFERPDIDFLFGDMIMYENERPFAHVKGQQDYHRALHRRMVIPQTSMVFRRRCFDLAGPYDTRLNVADDFEMALRMHAMGLKGLYVPQLKSYFRLGGHSTVTDFAIRERGARESMLIAIRYGLNPVIAVHDYYRRLAKTYFGLGLRKILPVPVTRILRKLVSPSGTEVF
jgi:glycosyltransferase involved in cell wall biosynthesis